MSFREDVEEARAMKEAEHEESPIVQMKRDMRLGGITRDPFAVGDVIRWTVDGGYTYSAIKTPVGWFTSAREPNMYVRQVYSYLEMVKMLLKREVVNLEVATEWRKVR